MLTLQSSKNKDDFPGFSTRKRGRGKTKGQKLQFMPASNNQKNNQNNNNDQTQHIKIVTAAAVAEEQRRLESARNKKKGKKVKIVNPNFLEYAKYTNDPFWSKLFCDVAIGKLLRNFYYNGTRLIHRKMRSGKSKINEIVIHDDPEIAANQCIDFFKTYSRIRSSLDKIKEKQIEEEILLSQKNNQLQRSDLKGKKRDGHILNFIQNMTKTLSLTQNERKQLQTIITNGFLLGKFKNDNIVIEGCYIIDIKGLSFNEDNRIFTINNNKKTNFKIKNFEKENEYLDSQTKLKSNYRKISLTDIWQKYTKNREVLEVVEEIVPISTMPESASTNPQSTYSAYPPSAPPSTFIDIISIEPAVPIPTLLEPSVLNMEPTKIVNNR